ncbi:MAG: His/Gly/Thr/Pro-type tRNA ligase C-terminal domain-containing protein, partial [Patescibacteria group bacterium]
IDKFDRKESHYTYKFISDGVEYDFNPTKGNMNFSPDVEVSIQGILSGNSITADVKNIKEVQNNSLNIENNAEAKSPYWDALGEQKILVFLVDFLNSTNPKPFVKREVESMLFKGKQQDFFKEQSYSRMLLSGTVTPWITLNRNFNDNNWVSLEDKKIRNYIVKNNINLADYERILFIVDHPSATGGNSYVGKGDVYFEGKTYILSQSWAGSSASGRSIQIQETVPFSYFDYTISHELGHAFGVMHANGYDCGMSSIEGVCEHLEYENYYDTMGYPEFSLHFNAFYKELLNNDFEVFFDEKGSIGKRYARIDEVGAPFGITIDYNTLKDNTVTIRERDSL